MGLFCTRDINPLSCEINRQYISLSIVSILLIIVNIIDVSIIEHFGASRLGLWLPSFLILVVWIYIMLKWCYGNFRSIPSNWGDEDYSQLVPYGVL